MVYHVHVTVTSGLISELSGDYGGIRLDGHLDGQPVRYHLGPGETARLTFDAMKTWEKGRYGFEYVQTYLDQEGQPLLWDGRPISHVQSVIVPADMIAKAHVPTNSSGNGFVYKG